MFALENRANGKRRRRSNNPWWDENDLQTQYATIKTKTAATLDATSLSQTTATIIRNKTARRVKATQIDDHNCKHSILSRGNVMKSIKNLLLMSDTITTTTTRTKATATEAKAATFNSPSSQSPANIGGKTISRNLLRTTRKTRDTITKTTTTTSPLATTTYATSLWPYGSITRRRHNCGKVSNASDCDGVDAAAASIDCCRTETIAVTDNCNIHGDNSIDFNNDDDRPCQSLRRGNHRRHFLLTLMLLLVVCIVNTSSVKAADSLTGKYCHILFLSY